ncbi:MAG TPA: amidohydrolase family protein [Vicinamibacterales bacterium]|nr:amidohydrolase family protein [Vicinamibacterales bacterium]
MFAAAIVLAFVGATVVDGTGAPPIRDAVVVVQDGRIAAVGPRSAVAIPPGAERVDVAGRFLIPGLTDMHVHFPPAAPGEAAPGAIALWVLQNLIAYGVTTAKESGFYAADARPLKADLDRGALPGPHLFTSGQTINGDAARQQFLEDVGDARTAVRRSLSFGADFIKIHNFVGPSALDAIVDEAQQNGLRVTGHVPLSLTMALAVDRGLYGLEHIRVRPEEVLDDPAIAARYPISLPVQKRELFWQYVDVNAAKPRALVDDLRRQTVYLDPTLVADEVTARHDAAKARIAALPLPDAVAGTWRKDRYVEGLTAEDKAAWEPALKARLAFAAAAFRAGVLVTAGTDAYIPYVYPGESLHRELALLVEAGLSPIDAIRCAGANAARALGHPGEFGAIVKGARADLVVLSADPAASIANTRAIVAVYKDGRQVSATPPRR